MTDERIREVLAEIAAHPIADWEPLLAKQFSHQPLLIQQALLWLHSTGARADHEVRPELGMVGDQRYELKLRLDSGATASVWQAHDRKLGRNVAIKVLHGRDETANIAQLIREARAACDVISDHVVRLLDVHDDEPRPYIVMELIGEHDAERGELVRGTAASACRPHSIAEAVKWVMQVARGVHDAHARNVFHRDLKPDNVLITPLSRHARIADFGLAVSAANDSLGPAATSLVARTSTGPISVSGTPEYMAPEQARGLPVHLDPSVVDDRAVLVGVDVWGLGALAYDLLVGEPPWTASRDSEPWELAASATPPQLGDRTPWGERIPSRLRRIVDKAMASNSSDRYRTAARVASELEAFLARRPTSFDRHRHVRIGLWCRRNPQLTLTALVAVGLILLVLATRATVTRLRGERNALNDEVATQQRELDDLDHSVAQTRQGLADTERLLKQRGEDLARLEVSIQAERISYQEVLEKKEAALREATAATRLLIDQLEAARAESTRRQQDVAAVRAELDAATKNQERLRAERDRTRGDRDAATKARDAAIAERDDARRALAKLQQELARLAGAPRASERPIGP